MTIIIGGSGSVGSTLLATILNRHSELFCGPELSLFNKEIVYSNWSSAKELIRARPEKFVTSGWGPYSGSNLYDREYCWDAGELDELLLRSSDITEFSTDFFEKPLSSGGKRRWVEKTPSNSFCFPEFLETFDQPLVVHLTRNPLDSVASLTRRGFSPIYAAGIWVYNSAMGLRGRDSSRCYKLTYESLTTDTETTIKELTDFLGIEFEAGLLASNPDSITREALKSWNFSPSSAVKFESVGSFRKAPAMVQDEIRTALAVFRVSDKHCKAKKLPAKSCDGVCDELGYDFDPVADSRFRRKISIDLAKDATYRTFRGYPTGIGNYPASLEW